LDTKKRNKKIMDNTTSHITKKRKRIGNGVSAKMNKCVLLRLKEWVTIANTTLNIEQQLVQGS
jgi:hypothetical protein